MRSDARLPGYRSHRPYARGPHRPPAPAPTRSADLVREVLGRLGGAGRALEFRVFDCYTRIIGAALRARSMPERLVGTTLFIRVSTSSLAHEMTLLRADILERMATEMGQGIVLDLRTRVGRIPSAAT